MELDRYEAELRASRKSRTTIATYVQQPERFINWLVGRYDAKSVPQNVGGSEARGAGRVSTYDPLQRFLESAHERRVRLTFAELETVLGRALPPSARKYRPWWANDEGGSHSHARAWLDAKMRVARVDMNAEFVVFER